MKRKRYIAYFFALLLINLIYSSAVARTEFNFSDTEKNDIIIGPSGINVPQWSVGDFWEYNMNLTFGNIICIKTIRCEAKVNEITDKYYILGLNGYLDKIFVNQYDYSLLIKALYLSGNAYIDKLTLAVKEFNINLIGNIQEPVKIYFRIDMRMDFDTNIDIFNFPIKIDEGDIWDIDNRIDFYISGYGNSNGNELFSFDEKSENNDLVDTLSVIKKEYISVPAGNFDSCLISGNKGNPSKIWYSPEVGFLVKVDELVPNFLKLYIKIEFGVNLELTSTNFNIPNNKYAPNEPIIDGPRAGKCRVEHEYAVSTTDPEGEKLYYMIDWGDGTCSDWIGPYESGESIKTKHRYMDVANFQIRVRAKDINGYQTLWSDSFTFSCNMNKELYSYFLRYINSNKTLALFFNILSNLSFLQK